MLSKANVLWTLYSLSASILAASISEQRHPFMPFGVTSSLLSLLAYWYAYNETAIIFFFSLSNDIPIVDHQFNRLQRHCFGQHHCLFSRLPRSYLHAPHGCTQKVPTGSLPSWSFLTCHQHSQLLVDYLHVSLVFMPYWGTCHRTYVSSSTLPDYKRC